MGSTGVSALQLALAGFAVAAFGALILTPLAARIAVWAGAIDRPGGARRVHERPTPRAGGLAVVVAFVLVGTLVLWYNDAADVIEVVTNRISPTEIAALFGGALLAAALGFVDDRFDLRARWQLLGQAILAAIVVAFGPPIGLLANPFGPDPIHVTGVFAALFAALWVVGMINSINWIDGLDGLSTGIGMIAAITLGIISLEQSQNQPIVGLLCFVLAGALAGFLPWNFHPARIFVGTTGVFVLGYALAMLSIMGTAKVAVALLVLGVPIIDTFWIIVRRLLEGRSPFSPDRGHLHHRLLDLGLSHREAVTLIYVICALLAALSFVLSGRGQIYAFLGIVVGGGFVLYVMTLRTREALDADTYDEPQEDDDGGLSVRARDPILPGGSSGPDGPLARQVRDTAAAQGGGRDAGNGHGSSAGVRGRGAPEPVGIPVAGMMQPADEADAAGGRVASDPAGALRDDDTTVLARARTLPPGT